MMHKMKLKEEEFFKVKDNMKRIEVRLYDEKRKNISVGDKIIFYKMPELKDRIITTVEQLDVFESFEKLYKSYPITYFGETCPSFKNLLINIYNIYSLEQEANNGVLAIKFQVDSPQIFPK